MQTLKSSLNKLIIGFGLILLSTMAFAGSKAAITVRPASEVMGEQVILTEIATIHGADKSLTEKLMSVTLCPSPLPGKSRMIARDQIIIAMRRQGILDNSVDVLCPPQFTVNRSASTVTGQAIFDVVNDFIMTANQWPGNVTVEPIKLPVDQLIPVGKAELKVRQGLQQVRKGRITLPVDVIVDGRTLFAVQVQVIVHVFAPVLVATQPIAKAETLTTTNTVVEEREITTLPEDIQTGTPSPGIVAKNPIGIGSIIRSSWVAVPPAIHSGDSVLVIVNSGAVRLSDKGTAVADGHVGEQIKIRLQGNTAREINGTVSGPGLVEINLGGRNS